MKNAIKENQAHHLWWFDKEQERYLPAGVAFYEESYGEYRLKIDVHPENQYYLRPILSTESGTQYRVEVVIKKKGKFKDRKAVGEGYTNQSTHGDIFINIGPYTRVLILGRGEQ